MMRRRTRRDTVTAPDWATTLVDRVTEDQGWHRRPTLIWRQTYQRSRLAFTDSTTQITVLDNEATRRRGIKAVLLHELAHWRIEGKSSDGHDAQFKANLAFLDHKYGNNGEDPRPWHERWGRAGCLGYARIPAGWSWGVEPCDRRMSVPCPTEGPPVLDAEAARSVSAIVVPVQVHLPATAAAACQRHDWTVHAEMVTGMSASGRALYLVRDQTCRRCGEHQPAAKWSRTLR